MSNNTYSNTSSSNNNVSSLAKDEELQKFESSFFPAGGAPQLANIPQAPPAPRNLNNVRATPLNLKTRNWGPKLENGYQGLNRSLYDRPNTFGWDNKPILGERAHLNNNNNNVLSSFPSSSSTSTTTSSRSIVNNIPSAIAAPLYRDLHNHLIHGKRLRIRNWGYPTAEGWSGMNRELYNGSLRLERDVLLNELRYKYGPRPNFQEQQQERSIVTETNLVETVPTTILTQTGPSKVLATTVPVPMLNPPINDGRRYAKLYKRNTNALASEKGLSKIVKRRGTRRDHLVQPNTSAPVNSIVTAAPYAGATVIQPATLVAETRSVLPVATGFAPLTTIAPTPAVSKAEQKREKRAVRDQQKFAKKEQRAARKANKKNGVVTQGPAFQTAAPIFSAPVLAAPVTTTVLPVTTTLVGSPALQTAAFPATTGFVGSPALSNATFVGETRSVLSQEATFVAPVTTTALPLTTAATTAVVTPVGVSAQPLDHSHVLAGQLGNAPVKRPRRARKAKKGTEQPMYSNIISSTPAPVTTTTITGAPITTGYSTSSSVVEGTTVVQPATLVSETRNIVVDPLVQQQQGMIKQEFFAAPTIAPLATGNPMM